MAEQHVAVVSGGTKGIGRAIVQRPRKDGSAVVTGLVPAGQRERSQHSRSATGSPSESLIGA